MAFSCRLVDLSLARTHPPQLDFLDSQTPLSFAEFQQQWEVARYGQVCVGPLRFVPESTDAEALTTIILASIECQKACGRQ